MLSVFFRKGSLLVSGNDFSRIFHRHYLFQIMISPDHPVEAVFRDGFSVEGQALLINSNSEHRCRTFGTSLSLFIDPESDEGRLFPPLFLNRNAVALDRGQTDKFLGEARDLLSREERDSESAWSMADRILAGLFPGSSKKREIDPRIRLLLDRIPAIPDENCKVPYLSEIVSLSESRLMHLFQENMGITIRRYLLWSRLMDGLRLIDEGETFSMAAMEAGFSDYAHFSRTFKENFGVSLKSIFKNSRFVHVLFQ